MVASVHLRRGGGSRPSRSGGGCQTWRPGGRSLKSLDIQSARTQHPSPGHLSKDMKAHAHVNTHVRMFAAMPFMLLKSVHHLMNEQNTSIHMGEYSTYP